jgi:hypothetical protein
MKQTVLNLTLFLCVGAGLVFLGCGAGAKKGTESTTNVGTLVISSVTDTSTPSAKSTTNLGTRDVYILEPYADGTRGLLYTIGIAESQDLSIARSMAIQRARAAMAQKAQVLVVALSEDFQQQLRADAKAKIDTVFRQVSQSIAAATLTGTIVVTTKATEKDGLYSIQLMLGMPIKSNIENPLVEEISQDAALYQEFQAWKGHNELAEKVKDLREREEKQ